MRNEPDKSVEPAGDSSSAQNSFASLWRLPRISRLVALAGVAVVVLALVFPALRRAKGYSGPGVRGQLYHLQCVKLRWEADHPLGPEWPSRQDLLPYLTNGTRFQTFDEAMKPLLGEIYIINRTGAPAFVYFPKGGPAVHEGELLYLTSNELQTLYPP